MASSPAPPETLPTGPETVLEQSVLGSRRVSNILVATVVTLGGTGFLLASLSSRLGRNLLPGLSASGLVWVPQGLVMGLYGVAAILLAVYLWVVIFLDLGGGRNRFDKTTGIASISRQGLRQLITVEIPLRDIQAVKVEIREGLSPMRRLALRIQGRRDLPLSRVGEPIPLADLESTGARLARFLGVPLEGL
ncbi:MAG: photosystem I assembly protein Ycf4 [Cyanobium sp.]